jgi:formate hydrogenlyase subunit 3/multisubunit Na+/H+ antiporter MnhD subunit
VALTQEKSKRLFGTLVGSQWSVILAAGALPTALGVSAITYTFASVFLWSALLAFIWGRFQEGTNGDLIQDVYGAARANRLAGLLLLIALASPLCVPGLPGFAAVLNLLAAMMEQRSLFYLFAEVVLVATLSLVCIQLGTDLLFRQRAPSVERVDSSRYGALDWLGLSISILALLSLGFLWHRVFGILGEAAKVFLK